MTSIWSRFGLSVSIALGASVGASATIQAPRPAPAPAPTRPTPVTRATVPPPAALHSQIVALGRAFDGQVGIAVQSIDNGWELGWKDDDLYPQQSVSKLWVSITALDAVDQGKVSLDDLKDVFQVNRRQLACHVTSARKA